MHNDNQDQLIQAAQRIASALERLSPTRPATDWNCHAFRWQQPGYMESVEHPHQVQLNDLLGIDRQKNELVRNTRQFIEDLPANNALLWGSRGTGKSSLIKALLSTYAGKGLRLIEVDAQHLVDLPNIIKPLYERREKFIIFSDDLSFEADDSGYKALKAILDGSISAAPENVLIYATSNRRHLLPEYNRDNLETRNIDGEIHHGEAVEEKISLSERFGLWLAFHPFNQDQYLDIVSHYLQTLGISIDNEVRSEALKHALARGSRSGRVAWQFATDWAGQKLLQQK